MLAGLRQQGGSPGVSNCPSGPSRLHVTPGTGTGGTGGGGTGAGGTGAGGSGAGGTGTGAGGTGPGAGAGPLPGLVPWLLGAGAGAGPPAGDWAGGGVLVPFVPLVPLVPLGGGVPAGPLAAGAPEPDGDGPDELLAPVVCSGGDDDVSRAPMAGPGAAGPPT